MYNSYEEYMQSVLGVRPEVTYGVPENMPYFEPRSENMNLQEVNKLYPEIYRLVYPMVQKACGMRNISVLSETQINEMVEEVYNAIEPDVVEVGSREETRNGDVKNPRVKETRRPANNFLLRDLIRILILRELLSGPGGRPPFPGGPRKTTTWRTTECQDLGGPRRKATCYENADILICTKNNPSAKPRNYFYFILAFWLWHTRAVIFWFFITRMFFHIFITLIHIYTF